LCCLQFVACSKHSSGLLRQVVIHRKDIFDIDQSTTPRLDRLVNAFHWVTREDVIRREVWLNPGEQVTAQDAQELERNLRALDLFAQVQVHIEAVHDSVSEVDLVITTRDRLSVVFSGKGSFLGGIGGFEVSAGEKNLFGLGHRLLFGYAENSEGELRSSLIYDNVLVAGNDVYAAFEFGHTEEGQFFSIEAENRFLNFQDDLRWLLGISEDETRIDYYEQGISVAEVPRTIRQFKLNGQKRSGSVARFLRFGPALSMRDIDYGQVIGENPSDIEVPLSTERLTLGATLALDRFNEFEKVQWLDTLSFVQDLTFGSVSEFFVGLRHDKTELESRTLPVLGYVGWLSLPIGEHNIIAGDIDASSSFDDGVTTTWFVESSLQWYNSYFKQHTLALNLKYKSAKNDGFSLPARQTLGEATGLRGYPAREFNGEQLILLNIENRTKRLFRIYDFDVGALGFFDVGWVNDRGDSFSDPHASAGLGIRVGSVALLGRTVIRLDVAYPFDRDTQRDYQPTVSFALGQVFGLSKAPCC